MTAEVAILRAYAFATQGKYAEAEQLLVSAPEALNTPSGTDLFARIKFEQGDVATARRIWEELLVVDATNESARNALAVIDAPLDVSEIDEPAPCFCRRRKYVCAAVLAVLLGFAFSLGKAWHSASSAPVVQQATPEVTSQPTVIAEQTLKISEINGKVLASLKTGILTNMTDSTILVISGGRGKYPSDRARCLAVIAENINVVADLDFSKIKLQIAGENEQHVKLLIEK